MGQESLLPTITTSSDSWQYVFDANVFNDFLQKNRNYSHDVFVQHWQLIIKQLDNYQIISLSDVYEELSKGVSKYPDLYHEGTQTFLKRYGEWFLTIEQCGQRIIDEAKLITNTFKIYGDISTRRQRVGRRTETNYKNYQTDLLLMSLSKARGLTLVTSEKGTGNIDIETKNPQIPDVCQHFNVGCLNVINFLRKEQ